MPTYNPPPVPLAGNALQTAVYVYDSEAEDGESFTLLPNVQCWNIQYREGNDPPTSHLAYILDNRAVAMGVPSEFEQLWPLDLPTPNLVGQYIATPDLRVVVQGMYPSGSVYTLFDGFARLPTAHVTPDSQAVTFTAVGVAVRCWDMPIDGRWQRDSVDPNEGEVVFVNLPCRFNPVAPGYPSGRPNCTPDDSDVNEGDDSTSFPVFLDPNIDRTPDPRTFWTLSKAVRYILSEYNPETPETGEDDGDSEDVTYHQYIQNPDFSDISEILDNRQPLEPGGYYDPDDPSSYTSAPIIVRDFDCTNMAWPDAIERLLNYHGFGMRWILEQDGYGQPNNTFAVYRKDAGNPSAPKILYYASSGTPLDPSSQNVSTLQGSFDYHNVANQHVVETHPNRYEVSIVLAPGFTPLAGDQMAEDRTQFLKQNIDGAALKIRQKYRYYIADECGDGYWDSDESKWVTGTSLDFSSIWLDNDAMDGTTPTPAYVNRYRKCAKHLITEDGNGDKYAAQLAFSRDYAGDTAVLWDGTGHWQPIDSGSWEMLDDRIGINITADDPEAIKVGTYTGSNPQNTGKILKGITCQAAPAVINPFDPPPEPPPLNNQLFYLRLTTVIESDTTIEAIAPRRDASPLQNIVERRVDAKEHWRKDLVAKNSAYFQIATEQFTANEGGNNDIDDVIQIVTDAAGNLIARDDTEAATDHAMQLRSAHEFPMVTTAFTVPAFTMAYSVGDRISLIQGRNVSLQTNAGTEQDEGPAYPFIVSLDWNFQGNNQSTTAQLADRRREPQNIFSHR